MAIAYGTMSFVGTSGRIYAIDIGKDLADGSPTYFGIGGVGASATSTTKWYAPENGEVGYIKHETDIGNKLAIYVNGRYVTRIRNDAWAATKPHWYIGIPMQKADFLEITVKTS